MMQFFLQVELDDYGIRLIKVDETPEFSPFVEDSTQQNISPGSDGIPILKNI